MKGHVDPVGLIDTLIQNQNGIFINLLVLNIAYNYQYFVRLEDYLV